jgi:DNA-binding MarR family transcriptional regulator
MGLGENKRKTPQPASKVERKVRSDATDPASSFAPIDLRKFLPYRLSIAANKVGRAIAAIYQSHHGLQQQEWKVMSILATFGPLRSADLTVHGTLDRMTLSRVLDRLDARGLILRERNSADQRTYVVALSTAGWAIYRDIVPAALSREAEMMACLTEEEAAALFSALEKLDRLLSRGTGS